MIQRVLSFIDYFRILPVEIKLEILTRLPTESAIDCKLVCTDWNNLVSHHPSFSKMHLHHLYHPYDPASNIGKFGFIALTDDKKFHYFDFNESHVGRIRRINFIPPIRDTKFVGSCHGLICFARGPVVWICNPITKEFVLLPRIKDIHEDRNWISGFGYVSSSNEYKVVEICQTAETQVQVYVYNIGSGNGWRYLVKVNSPFSTYYRGREHAIFANGALYWMHTELDMITIFDLAEEMFCENIALPPSPEDCGWGGNRIGVLDGVLYISQVALEGGVFFDTWLLRNHDKIEGEEHQSPIWSKQFRIDNGYLLAVIKSDGALTYFGYYLNMCDTKTSTSNRLVKFKSRLVQVSPHKNTLVSLKELGEKDTETMESDEMDGIRSHDYLQEEANPDYIYL